jgi:hypothetical protein
MFRAFSLIALLVLSAAASALDSSDVGTYAVVHRDGHVTNFTFFVSSSKGSWDVEQQNPDGSWNNVTCEHDCLLRESTSQDIKRFFPSSTLAHLSPSCVNNTAFAFCNYTAQASSQEKGYIFIALVTPKPTPMRLKKLSNIRHTP